MTNKELWDEMKSLRDDIKSLRSEIQDVKLQQVKPLSTKSITLIIGGISAVITTISTTLISIFGK